MSKIGLVFILILTAGRNYAQQNYFILIQADNKQPFYVRLGDKSVNSSAEGYLILGQLKDSTYNIAVGFPGQTSGEQRFSISLHSKDQQFLLRNQDKGLVLYNPLTGEMRMPDPKEEKVAELQSQGVKKDDAFSRLMAGVVRDTAVMYNTYAMDQPLRDSPIAVMDSSIARNNPRLDTPAAVTTAGSASLVSDTPAVKTVSSGQVPPTNGSTVLDSGSTTARSGVSASGSGVPSSPVSRVSAPGPVVSGNDSSAASAKTPPGPAIVKLSERKLPHTRRLAFADRSAGKKADTIIMYIYLDTPATASQRAPGALTTTGAGATAVPSGKTIHPADTSHRVSSRNNGPNSDNPAPISGTPATTTGSGTNSGETARVKPDTVQKRVSTKAPLPFVNSDCHAFATDYDVDKLRVKMLESSKDDDRIQAARKTFKSKCFSTKQIRALSEVFTTDALKFRFYETAYPFASDDQFRELGSTLTDPVYNSKFKAMTGQQ